MNANAAILLTGLMLFQLATESVLGQSATNQIFTDNVTSQIEFKNKTFTGKPLGFDGQKIAMLNRAGKLLTIPANSPSELKKIADQFVPYSHSQVESILFNEFGKRYDISRTDRFVVVHPWGPSSVYGPPFEDFFQRFVQFFEANGIELEEPEVPLIALVLRSRNDFDRYLINEVDLRDSRVGGYYSRLSNRITTFDPRARIREAGDKWIYEAGPIIHEATHQSAFNTGLHNRFAPPPKWISEGIATLFEAKGFNHAAKFVEPIDRVNAFRLKVLRKRLSQQNIKKEMLNLIANDKLFQVDVELAYALSWGLSFYLFETRKEQYFEFLKKDASRPDFRPYPANRRFKDFASSFGNDFEKLLADFTRFYMRQTTKRLN